MVLPSYYISHGGGPWPYVAGPMRDGHAVLEAALRDMPRQLGREPKAVLMVSGHWEEAEFTVTSSAHPPMLYDYGGFPEHTYRVKYEAAGSPALAAEVQALAQSAGLVCRSDGQRGFDHSAFVPLEVIYPEARVPVVQLSLRRDFDPAHHLALGRALAPLREQGVLIIGSGSSYHNLGVRGTVVATASKAFDDWLGDTLAAPPEQREHRLVHWTDAPCARLAHPREEHLLPLMVVLGTAPEEEAIRVYHEEAFFGGATVSSFRFGHAAPGAVPVSA